MTFIKISAVLWGLYRTMLGVIVLDSGKHETTSLQLLSNFLNTIPSELTVPTALLNCLSNVWFTVP